MNTETFNYRNQLIKLYFCLDLTVCNLYSMAFNIGLEEEWQDLKPTFFEGPGVEMYFDYLEAIKHPAVPEIIKILHILIDLSESLVNQNDLRDEELVLPEGIIDDEDDEEEDVEESNDGEYLDGWLQGMYSDLLNTYEAIWVLAHEEQPPMAEYDKFGALFYDGGLEIDSRDENVRISLEALNKVLEINGTTDYYYSNSAS